MVRRLIRPALAAALLLLAGACATAGGTTAARLPASGYLDSAALDTLAGQFTPTPQTLAPDQIDPSAGPGTDRWWLATAQAQLRAPEAAQHFDCILGTRLAEQPRPALSRLMNRLLVDSDTLTRRLAATYVRQRPVAVDPTLQPCQRINDAMRDSPSWPAGAAVAGAAYGRLFAELAPDKGAMLQAMGHEIGLSRRICRMNWQGDVADGERIGQALYARAAASPGFAADLEAARAEVTAARAEGLTNPSCASERRALSQGSN
ncbi:MAG: PA-phosphatase [Brevundimonas sp.]